MAVIFSDNFDSFRATGFAPTPVSGQLDSDVYRVTGFTDGNGLFGGTHTTGDFGRGVVTAPVTSGGVYALDEGGGDHAFWTQATGDDFSPGTITIAITNTSGATADQFSIDYDLLVRNDGGRSNSFNFAVSNTATGTFQPVPALNYTSVEAANGTGITTVAQSATFTLAQSVDAGETFYIQFQSDDIGGSGTRDEFGLDNISVETVDGPAEPTLSIADASIVEGDAGAQTMSFTVTLANPPAGTVTVDYATADGTATTGDLDYIGAAGTLQFDPGVTTQTIFITIASDTRVEPDENFTVTLSNANGAAIGDATATGTIVTDDIALTLISDIQGTPAEQTDGANNYNDDASAMVGQQVTVEAIVTADFQTGMGGFYIQEEDADSDGDATTSEGIYVFNNTADVQVGDRVRITGTVAEYFGETQLSNTTSVVVTGEDQVLPTAAVVELPTAKGDTAQMGRYEAALEQYEGMRVTFADTLTLTEQFQLDRYNEVGLFNAEGFEQVGSDGEIIVGERPYQYTQHNAPDVAGNDAYLREIASRTIFYDDGSSEQNLPIDQLDGFEAYGEPGAPGAPSMGDTIDDLAGVLSYSRNGSGSTVGSTWRVRATGTDENTFDDTNPAPDVDAPTAVEGDLKIASLNVLNYFTTIDTPGTSTEIGEDPRGADTPEELARQEAKLVSAIVGMDADVLGLLEIENDLLADNGTVAIERLVSLVNAELGRDVYDWVRPGQEFVGGDAIAVGMIYNTETVQLAAGTETATLNDAQVSQDLLDQSTVGGIFDGENTSRNPLAAAFQAIAGGEEFTVVVNHLKSKGGTATGEDADQGDGAGSWNQQRELAVQALTDWLATNPTGSANADNQFLLGDFNAYGAEGPTDLLEAAGFTDVAGALLDEAYSYVFDGLLGTLDYVWASAAIFDEIVDALEWHINSDQADAIDYNTDFGRDPDYFDADSPLRGSDHDPVLAGFTLPDDGTTGVDTVVGGAGDDDLLFVAASLTAGDTIDGGAGTDELTLSAGGTFDFRGVTLQRLESIRTTSTTGTTMVFATAADALLVSDAAGAADVVTITQEGLGPDVVLALLDAGVETINLQNGDERLTATARPGGGIVATFTDASVDGSAANYTTRVVELREDLSIVSEVRNRDDGTIITREFAPDGDPTRMVQELPDGSITERTFGADGLVDEVTRVKADGVEVTTSFDDAGVRTSALREDVENARSFDTIETTYVNGVISQSEVTYDDGAVATSLVRTFDATGTIVEAVKTYANGEVLTTDYAAGVRVLTTLERLDNSVRIDDLDVGDNELRGTNRADEIFAGGGDDVLFGRGGDDLLRGGAGIDRFVHGGGDDTILDFARQEILDLSAYGIVSADDADLTITVQDDDTLIEIAGEGSILLENYTRELRDANFMALV